MQWRRADKSLPREQPRHWPETPPSKLHNFARRPCLAWMAGVLVSTLLGSAFSVADDTEVFFGRAATDGAVAANAPNILFVLDDSHSMLVFDKGHSDSRLTRLQTSMREILTNVQNVNIGLATMNGRDGGGAVRFPVTAIDKPMCEGIACHTGDIVSAINDVADDTSQLFQGSILPALESLVAVDDTPKSKEQLVGLRFGDIGIPQGARITSAVLEMTASTTDSTPASFVFRAEASDDAPRFEERDNDLTDRPLTLATVTGPAENWISGERYQSPDLSPILQELVNRPGWCAGANVAMMIGMSSGERSLMSLESVLNGGDGAPASLHISYDVSALPAGEKCFYDTLSLHNWRNRGDLQENVASGVIDHDDKTLHIPLSHGRNMITGLSFPLLQLDQGTEVVESRIEFTISEVGEGTPDIRIYGQDVGNDFQFGTGGYHLSSRKLTDANVRWRVPATLPVGEKLFTADISSIVQEILDRPDWQRGNAISFLLHAEPENTGYHSVYSMNNKIDVAVVLYTRVKRYKDLIANLDGQPEHTARDELLNIIDTLRVNMYTPMVGTQFEAAQHMMGGDVVYGVSRGFPYEYSAMQVSHPASYTGGTVVTPANCNSADPFAVECQSERIIQTGLEPLRYVSPMLDSCQTNHMVLLGDGGSHLYQQDMQEIHELIGDASCDSHKAGSNSCGAQLSEWLYENDHAPHIDGVQNIRTHTIAYTAGADVEFYADIAERGGGESYQAESAIELITAFSSIVDGALGIDTAFTSPGATVNQFNRLSHRQDIYFTLFQPADRPVWHGNLKRYQLAPYTATDVETGATETAAEILDVNGQPAIDRETGFFKDDAKSFWEHLDHDGFVTNAPDGRNVAVGGAAGRIGIDGIEQRKLYTYLGTSIPIYGVEIAAEGHDVHVDNQSITAELLGVQESERDDLIQWIRGYDRADIDQDGDKDEPRRRMGDPMHSPPVIVNYRTGAEGVGESDNSVIFVSTNEGLLHAIDSKTGEEIWAFAPAELMGNHRFFYKNLANTRHPYGLDGGLTLWRDEADDDFVIEDGESAYLYVSMRRGGSKLYAFDVTKRDAPRLAWVIHGGAEGTPGFEELGQTWSPAQPARVEIAGVERDVLIFGGGYDTNQDADPRRDINGNTVVMEHTQDSVGRGLYLVDARTGELLWSVSGPDIGTDSSPDLRLSEMRYSIPNAVRAVDTDGDQLVDQVYASDTGGQVWRFDVVGDGSGGSDLMRGGVLAKVSDSEPRQHRRFYAEPDVALVQKEGDRYLAISIGSGWRAHPLNDVVEDAQYVFRVRDISKAPEGYGRQLEDGRFVPLTEEDLALVNPLQASAHPLDYTHGWFLRLHDAGEKVMGRSLIFQNVLYFSTYVPAPDSEACTTGLGTGYSYALSITDGMPVLDFSGDGHVNTAHQLGASSDARYELQHQGPPPSPTVLISEGQDPEVFVGTERVPTEARSRTTRTFWVDSGRQ